MRNDDSGSWCDDDDWFDNYAEHDCGLGQDARAYAVVLGVDPDEGDFADLWENITKNE